MSSGTLAPASRIPVTRTARPKRCPICSTSLGTVGFSPEPREVHLLTGRAELSIAPQLNARLVPHHARGALAARGLDIDNFVPMTKDEMMARLD